MHSDFAPDICMSPRVMSTHAYGIRLSCYDLHIFTHAHVNSALLSLVLYFVIGAIVLYNVKGARGLEAFPNYAFWKDLPLLVKVL